MKNRLLLALTLVVLGIGFFFFSHKERGEEVVLNQEGESPNAETLNLQISDSLLAQKLPNHTRRFNGRMGEGKRKAGDLIFSHHQIETDPQDFTSYREGDEFSWEVVPGFSYSGKVFTFAQKTAASSTFAVLLDNEEGRLVVSQNEWGTDIRVYYTGKGLMHMFRHTQGEWTAIETHLTNKLCADLGSKHPVIKNFKARVKWENATKARIGGSSNGVQNPPLTGFTGDPNFQSKPNSQYVIYLDFDGETNLAIPDWAEPTANPPIPAVIDVTPSGLSDAVIHYVMCAVAEDFAPFDVNVTNVRSVFEATPSNRRTMCITTPDTLLTDGGGVALGDSFVLDSVSWNSYTEVPSDIADTISHEVGHQVGLDHDGYGPLIVDTNDNSIPNQNGIVEYHDGYFGTNKESWAPIMGAGIGVSLAQWTKLEYRNGQQYNTLELNDVEYQVSYDATEVEDDFVVVTENGIPLMTDDHGNTLNSATDFTVDSAPYTISGIIGANNDIDAFKMTFTGLGTVNFFSGNAELYSNLDARMKIYDASQTLLFDYDGEDFRTAHYETNLQAGTYYITIEGDGAGTPMAVNPSGYTKYGSVGYYDLTVTPHPVPEAAGVELNKQITHSNTPVPWQSQSQIAHDGKDAMQAGRVSHGDTSSFSFTADTRSISFWYKVSSELDGDYLSLYIDGVKEDAWSGEQDWTQYTVNNLSPGTHTFRFEYACDGDTTRGFNSAWVDQIVVDDELTPSQWQAQNGLSGDGTASSDGDGFPDLMEYAAGTDPNLASNFPVFCVDGDTGDLEFTRNTERTGVITRLLLSDDLSGWEVGGVSYDGGSFIMKSGEPAVTESGSSTNSKIQFPLNDGSTRRFGRLEFQAY